jgi:hypothetical protein
MSHDDYAGDAQSLTHLIDPALLDHRLWQPEELGAILVHQCEASLARDLEPFVSDLAARLADAAAEDGPPLRTFGDLLAHPRPPLELLDAVKQFARHCRTHPDGPLPEEIATVLYLAAIVAARVRLGERITSMDDAALRSALDWALGQPWLDPATRTLLDEPFERS